MKHPKQKTLLLLFILNLLFFSCSKEEGDGLKSLEDGAMAITINGEAHSFGPDMARAVLASSSGYSLFSIVGAKIGTSGSGNNTSISVSVFKEGPIVLSDSMTFNSPTDDMEVEYQSYTLFDDSDGILAYTDNDATLSITEYNVSEGKVSGEFSATVTEGDTSYDIEGKFLNIPITGS